jgi:sulfotransferase family protein
MLPNLIVIGAAKCGTTSLHEYLDEHPEISMSREKELHFFVEEKNWSRGLEWYEAQFDASAPVRGESSPGYSVFPLRRGVPERIARTIPGARLVYCVRDPIERIVSHYTHRTVNWPEMGTLEEALADPHVREWLVTPSHYWLQLERYLAHFPPDQILVLDSDELRTSRDEVLAGVFAFVGVDPSFRSPAFRRAHNAATGRTRRNRAGQAVSTLLERTLGSQRSQALREHAPQALKAPFRYEVEAPMLTDELRATLEAELRGEVERLREHTGLAFAGWSI